MNVIDTPDPVGIWADKDWEENCIRLEEAGPLEWNLGATERLLPPRERAAFLGIFTDPDGRLWLARRNERLSRGDPSGLTWYEFQAAS